MSFPKDFVWGTASSAYQIEGAAFEDGKGPSIWDVFTHEPGRSFEGQTGDISADEYHHLDEDLDIMQSLGIKNYRFSISWPRVFPEGVAGKEPPLLNPIGIAYYDRLVDGCLGRGITPWITLYHWDLPYALFEKGGWLSRETARHFADYASYIADHFKGRVSKYITINEPQCIVGMGHISALHAPGIKYGYKDQFTAWHNVLLAHGLAVRAVRASVPDASIGLASTGALAYTAEHLDKTPEELVRASFETFPLSQKPGFYFNHQWCLDPILLGRYPDDPENPWTQFTAEIPNEDMEVISTPIDFAGLNIYNGTEMEPDKSGEKYIIAERYPGFPRTALKWPVCPGVLYWGPRVIYERYGKPIYIFENGQSCNDRIFLDGMVHDPDRIDFLHRYLRECRDCVEDGIPVKGYFHWSFTDNLEWHSGYDDRFGLVYIDYRSQERILKDSARWYAEVISENGNSL